MSHLPIERVYNGFWVDHAQGDILGATITTGSDTSNIVVAIVSILIAFAGSHLWDVIAYLSFTASTRISNHGEVYHQQRILLRNVTTPAAFLVKSANLYSQQRKHTRSWKPFTPLASLAITAVLCSVGFLAAGIISSQIVSTINIDILVQPRNCGFINQNFVTIAQDNYSITTLHENAVYAHDCYNASTSDPACQIYITKSIPFNTTYDICPFQDLCSLKNNNQALKMDTGLLWSDNVFGINMHPSSALAIRQVTKCAPLNLTSYIEVTPMDNVHAQFMFDRDPLPGEMFINLNMGRWPGVPFNATVYDSSITRESSYDYTMTTAMWYRDAQTPFQDSPWLLGNSFDPIDPLRNLTGDLTIINVNANRLAYFSPVDDPFFAAHDPKIHVLLNSDNVWQNTTVYDADWSSGKMGCIQQYQFCTPKNECTDLTFVHSAASQAVGLDLDSIQNATLYMYANVLINFSIGLYDLGYVAPAALLANDGRISHSTPALPLNQWELEVKYWTSFTLAMVQRYVTDFAVGQQLSGTKLADEVNLPPGPSESALCQAQKMKAPNGVSNISVFGLSFTIGLCGLIILTSLALPTILRLISKFENKKWDFIKRWDEEELLEYLKTTSTLNNGGASTVSAQTVQVIAANKPSTDSTSASTTSNTRASSSNSQNTTPGQNAASDQSAAIRQNAVSGQNATTETAEGNSQRSDATQQGTPIRSTTIPAGTNSNAP